MSVRKVKSTSSFGKVKTLPFNQSVSIPCENRVIAEPTYVLQDLTFPPLIGYHVTTVPLLLHKTVCE